MHYTYYFAWLRSLNRNTPRYLSLRVECTGYMFANFLLGYVIQYNIKHYKYGLNLLTYGRFYRTLIQIALRKSNTFFIGYPQQKSLKVHVSNTGYLQIFCEKGKKTKGRGVGVYLLPIRYTTESNSKKKIWLTKWFYDIYYDINASAQSFPLKNISDVDWLN